MTPSRTTLLSATKSGIPFSLKSAIAGAAGNQFAFGNRCCLKLNAGGTNVMVFVNTDSCAASSDADAKSVWPSLSKSAETMPRAPAPAQRLPHPSGTMDPSLRPSITVTVLLPRLATAKSGRPS